jgi:hypothetical protein
MLGPEWCQLGVHLDRLGRIGGTGKHLFATTRRRDL